MGNKINGGNCLNSKSNWDQSRKAVLNLDFVEMYVANDSIDWVDRIFLSPG